MSRYIVATKFKDNRLETIQGEVVNTQPLKIKDGEIINIEDWVITTDFRLNEDQENLTNQLETPESINDIDMKNAQSILSESDSTKIKDISESYSIHQINNGYELFKNKWLSDKTTVDEIFKSHEDSIEDLSNIEILQSPVVQSEEANVFISTD